MAPEPYDVSLLYSMSLLYDVSLAYDVSLTYGTDVWRVTDVCRVLQVVGPPGTGKTDVAVQIISNLYHNFPDQRTLIVTHSNQVR